MKENPKILIIEDEISNINIIVEQIEKAEQDYSIYHAVSSETGLEAAEKFVPNVILTDWDMPDASGIETIKILKKNEKLKQIPVIMVTGKMTKAENLETALNAGAVDFVRKPVNGVELRARINSALQMTEYYRQVIESKDRELTTLALTLAKHTEFADNIIESLKSIKAKHSESNRKLFLELNDIIRQIEINKKDKVWKNFLSYFKNVHPDFYKNLMEKHPKITPGEIKLASLIRLNMTSKDIALITSNSYNSIKTLRSRLRSKLDLSKDQNLTNYLHRF